MRGALILCCSVVVAPALVQAQGTAPLSLLDVPYISQTEALCGGAAAAMVLRYWGERGISAESFASLVDRSAAGIRTDTLIRDLRQRGWMATGINGNADSLRGELSRGRPVLTLMEDRPSVFHYVVVLAWHERGVVFHDPARGPFTVMSAGDFDRRWRQANRWMAIVLPATRQAVAPESSGAELHESSACDQLVAEGVKYAESNDLPAAERVLSLAIDCPAAVRELAGVRVLQRRWSEAADLASSAIAADAWDTHAWYVLAASRFVQDDRLGALAAWNRMGEPRLDLVQVDGLTRTRHHVVERLIDLAPGDMLSPRRFVQAKRRLAMLPAASSTRLEYVPVPLGMVELRGIVVERPMLPKGRLPLAAVGLAAAATREVRIASGSFFGGGEQLTAAWRFWPGRTRVAAALQSPAPWGGIWGIDAFTERQAFSLTALPRAERTGARLGASDWMTSRVRWSAAAGLESRSGETRHATASSSLDVASRDDRVDVHLELNGWAGTPFFGTASAGISAWSSTEQQGVVFRAAGTVQGATAKTPLDLWWSGDTGHARATLLRAHPVLDGGRLRVDRLGRTLIHGSLEVQRWWRIASPVRTAAAAFGDVGRTAFRLEAPSRTDMDLGLGARLAVTGVPGIFRIDVAKGLQDGATAVSFVYEP